MVGIAVENQIVMLPTFCEILIGVINHLICANGADHFHVPRAGYPSHIRAERLGYLNSERAHTSACSVNQDFLSRLNVPLVAKTDDFLYGGRRAGCDSEEALT
jgi:hypothetical protein